MHFKDIVCDGAATAVYINGLPEMPVRGLDFSDCLFSAQRGVDISYADGVSFRNVSLDLPDGQAPVKVARSKNIDVEGIR